MKTNSELLIAAPPQTQQPAWPASASTDGQTQHRLPAWAGIHLPKWSAEFLGTALFVFVGLSAISLDFGTGSPVIHVFPSPVVRYLLVAILFAGAGSLIAISWLGRRSGAHLNPSITIAFFLTGKIHRTDLIGYIFSQCLGAYVGAKAVQLLWGPLAESVQIGATIPSPDINLFTALYLEILMTATFLLTFLLCVSNPRTARWTPLALWIVLTLLAWYGAPRTGFSINPARSLGPALITGNFTTYWIDLAGPLLGTLLAVGLVRLFSLYSRLLTAKLFSRG